MLAWSFWLKVLCLALGLALVISPAAFAVTGPESQTGRPVPGALTDDAIADLAASLDYDVEKIYRFVADEIRYEPYAGILRGAEGTLSSRAGNSVDQSLLLAASAGLNPDEARAVAEGLPPDGPNGARNQALEIDEEDLDRMIAAGNVAHELARSRVHDTRVMLEAALANAEIVLDEDVIELPAEELAAHTWVQIASGAEWLDLDPTLLHPVIGESEIAAVETIDGLPDDLRHEVAFEVSVERVRGGRLVTEPILEYVAFADEIVGLPITFAHVLPSAMQRLGLAISSVLGEGDLGYHPVLEVRASSIVADEAVAFHLSGTEAGEGILGDSGLFEDVGPPASPTGLRDGEATAEWLAVTVTSPGAEPVTARRTIFDRVPSQVRYSGEASPDSVAAVDLIDLDGTGPSDFAPLLGIKAFAIATAPTDMTALLRRLTDTNADLLALLATAFLGLRDSLAAEVSAGVGFRTYLAGPNIVSFSVDVDEIRSEVSLRSGLDIWHREVAVWPLDDVSAAPAAARITAGVTDHVAERVALEAGTSAAVSEGPVIGVGAVFEAAARAGIPATVLRGERPAALPYGPSANALIAEALDAGDVVVIPAEVVSIAGVDVIGWWRVDPTTGATVDVMGDGSGASFAERLVQRVVQVAGCLALAGPFVTGLGWALLSGWQSKAYGVFNSFFSLIFAFRQGLVPAATQLCLRGG